MILIDRKSCYSEFSDLDLFGFQIWHLVQIHSPRPGFYLDNEVDCNYFIRKVAGVLEHLDPEILFSRACLAIAHLI